jgi:hypothetical protein
VIKLAGRIVAGGMLRINTSIEDYMSEFGLFVKREDKACPPPGPPFSKTRGVYAWVAKRPESMIGVLDTFHSQAGHAVARACQILGKRCVNFYPHYKADTGLRPPQIASQSLGADLVALPAGRSCILYHVAKKETERRGGVMIPNALKLDESVQETAKEVPIDRYFDQILIPASSGTIAAGVIKGFGLGPKYLIHLGYSRSEEQVRQYLRQKSGLDADVKIIDEKYAYKDVARSGLTPPWPCNRFYDLKAFRWWLGQRERYSGSTLLWNVG